MALTFQNLAHKFTVVRASELRDIGPPPSDFQRFCCREQLHVPSLAQDTSNCNNRALNSSAPPSIYNSSGGNLSEAQFLHVLIAHVRGAEGISLVLGQLIVNTTGLSQTSDADFETVLGVMLELLARAPLFSLRIPVLESQYHSR